MEQPREMIIIRYHPHEICEELAAPHGAICTSFRQQGVLFTAVIHQQIRTGSPCCRRQGTPYYL